MAKSRYIVVALSISVLLLSMMLGFAFMLNSNNNVYADYVDDVLNNPTALVNFNQISNEIGISHDGTMGSSGFNNHGVAYFPNSLDSSHHYLVKFYFEVQSGTIESLALFSQNYTYVIYSFENSGYSIITGWSNISLFRAFGPINTSYEFTAYISIIDLDVMFGSYNLPNLAQCQDLFVADYYAYNTGTPVSFNSLENYTIGYENAIKSNTAVYSSTLLSSMVFANQGRLWNDGRGFFIGVDLDSTTNIAEFGFRFPVTLLSGDTCKIEMTNVEFQYNQNTQPSTTYNYLYIGYYENGSFVNLATLDSSNMTFVGSYLDNGKYYYSFTDASVTFTMPVDISVIYFRSVLDFNVMSLNVDVHTLNTAIALSNAYDDGYEKASEYYEKLYARGGTMWQSIYYEGYYDYENDDHYDFRSLIAAAIDTPVQAMTNLFDFDILGINMKTFYLSIFTLCVIIMIIKLVL